MKRIIWFTLAAVMLVLIVAIFTYMYVFRKADVSVASKKADIEIKASELLKKFTDDENSANATFLDKVIVVEGTIASITEDSSSVSIYMKNLDDIAGIQCGFDKTAIDKSTLMHGDTIHIKGICTGYLMDVVLNKCAIEK